MRRAVPAIAAAMVLGWAGLVSASARALPAPVRHCGVIVPGVPLRAGVLDTTGHPPRSCRVARRVIRRFLRTTARRTGPWTCERPLRQESEDEVIASCVRDRRKSYRSFLTLYVPATS
jgi:hypothetical protein